MHFKVKQSYIKHSGYYCTKIIHYRVNTSLTKQHKSASNTGREGGGVVHIMGSGGFLTFRTGNGIQKGRKTRRPRHWSLKTRFLLPCLLVVIEKCVSLLTLATYEGHCQTVRCSRHFSRQIRPALSRSSGKNPAWSSFIQPHFPPPNNHTRLRPKKQLTGMMTKVMVSFLFFISLPYVS
jgi:hypothetical protein